MKASAVKQLFPPYEKRDAHTQSLASASPAETQNAGLFLGVTSSVFKDVSIGYPYSCFPLFFQGVIYSYNLPNILPGVR